MSPLASQDSLPSAGVLPVGLQDPRVGPATIVRNHEAVLRFTEQVFPRAKIIVEEGSDPENGDDEYFVISVGTPGDVSDLVVRHGQWHQLLRQTVPETAKLYRLLLDVQ